MELQFRAVAAARAFDVARRKEPFLDELLPALLPQDAAAETGGDLVDYEDEEIDEPTWAAATDGGALGGCPSGDFGQSVLAIGDVGLEQRLPAVQGGLGEEELS